MTREVPQHTTTVDAERGAHFTKWMKQFVVAPKQLSRAKKWKSFCLIIVELSTIRVAARRSAKR